MSMLWRIGLLVFCVFSRLIEAFRNSSSFSHRQLSDAIPCDKNAVSNANYKRYFETMQNIYSGTMETGTCLPVHRACGWPHESTSVAKDLPLLVLSVGLEGAGHHLWTELLQQPVFDCVWTNARHYKRDIADGVPRTTVEHLREGLTEQLQMRKTSGKPACKYIYDSEDSFPTGAIRKHSRLFMRPDIVNLQKLDGVLFDIKYLIIMRNNTVSSSVSYRRHCRT